VLKLQGKTGAAEAAYQRALTLDRSLQDAVVELAALARDKERSTELGRVGAKPAYDEPAAGSPPVDRVGQSTDMAFAIEDACADHVAGWAVSPKGLNSIWISIDGKFAGRARTGIARPDIGAQLPDIADSDRSGFLYVFR